MTIKLNNGKEIILEDVVKDPKTASLEWLQRYGARSQAVPGSQKEIGNGKAQDKFDRPG